MLGNGDIYDAGDALAMMSTTGCDGVVIGRGCLGRPWLFAELSAAFTGSPAPTPPTLGEVADIIRRHGTLLAAHFGEDKGMRDIRKHIAWYLHGFPAGSALRRALAMVKTFDELDCLLDRLDGTVPFPDSATGARGRQGSPARVALPDGWLTDPDDCRVPEGRTPWGRVAESRPCRNRVWTDKSVRCGPCCIVRRRLVAVLREGARRTRSQHRGRPPPRLSEAGRT